MRRSSILPALAALTLPLHGAVVVAAGYNRPTPVDIAPGQVITFYVQGMGANLTTAVFAPSLPLPLSLGGISAQFVQGVFIAPVPLLSVRPVSSCAYSTDPGCASSYFAIRVQIPFGFDYSDPTVIRGVPVIEGQLRFSENGAVVASVDLTPYSDQVHVLRNCDDFSYNEASCAPMVTHADGSPVDLGHLARSGEEIVIYAVGLGAPKSTIQAGQAVISPIPMQVSVSYDWLPNVLGSRAVGPSLAQPAFAGLVTGYVGLYQINVVVPALPAGTPACNGFPPGVLSNLTINIVGHSSFDGARICAAP